MNNNDYKTDFEEQRKEIDLDNGTDEKLPSRVERHGRGRKTKKTSNHTMINIILGIFAFIPILIFAFVIYNFYFGSDSGSASDNSDVTMDISPGKTEGSISVVGDSEKDDDSNTVNEKDNTNTDVGSGKPPVSVNPSVNGDGASDTTGKTETEAEKPEVKPETKPQAKPKPEAKPEIKPQEKPKPETKPETKPQSATHVVAANETLYRISMNYYGSDVGVEKIKKANGLSSNDIMAGQKLIIPK